LKLITNRLYFSAFALSLSLLLFLSISNFLLKSAHASYWKAIYRVQTVDFNILSATLPGLFSTIIKSNNKEKARMIIGANFDIFPIIVMKCQDVKCKQQILFAKNKSKYFETNWKTFFNSIEDKIKIPIFIDPSSQQHIIFDHSYSDTYRTQGYKERVIGYIYLFRGLAPTYKIDMRAFFSKWWNDQPASARHTSYKASIALAFGISLAALFLSVSVRLMFLSWLRTKLMADKLLFAINERFGVGY